MSINKGMFSSNSDNWATPQDFFDILNKEFNFNLDVCASEDNAKCNNYFTEEDDGLSQDWTGRCWMNPPYGRSIGKWIEKAYESSLNGATVVCLIPSRTDTRYMHNYVFEYAKYIGFIKGRLKFGGSENSAPFPSMIAIFTNEDYDDEIFLNLNHKMNCKWVKL